MKQLVDDGNGEVRAELRPFVEAMVSMGRPKSGLVWLRQPGVSLNLTLLATGQVEISHDGLNSLTPWRSVAYLRDLLMECGVLPHADRYLIQFQRWLAEWLAAVDDPEHQKALERFATWELSRLRSQSERKPLNWSRIHTDRMLLLRSAEFLIWLADHGLTLPTCRQAHLDGWFAEHTGQVWKTRPMLPFLCWCMDQQLMMGMTVVPPRIENPSPISQEHRLSLIREVLTCEDYPLLERAVALLVLLYAQPISRIVRLTVQDVVQDDTGVWLRLGDPPSPVPEPFASVLLCLRDQRPNMTMATNEASRWLLPGGRAGQPMEANTVRKRLALAGIPNLHARTAALRQLVLQAPASVVAGMLGFHPVHTAFVTRQAGADWSRYATGDHTRPTSQRSLRPNLDRGLRDVDKLPAFPAQELARLARTAAGSTGSDIDEAMLRDGRDRCLDLLGRDFPHHDKARLREVSEPGQIGRDRLHELVLAVEAQNLLTAVSDDRRVQPALVVGVGTEYKR